MTENSSNNDYKINLVMIAKMDSIVNVISTAMEISEEEAMELAYTSGFADDVRNEDYDLWHRSPIQLFQIFCEDYLHEDVYKYINEKEPFDYTEWRKENLFKGMTGEEISREAMEYCEKENKS